MYEAVPIPEFYNVVVIFEGVAAGDMFVFGGDQHDKLSGSRSIRWPGPCPARLSGNGGGCNLDELIAPWVRDRGYDWEFTITEPPFDLWSLQGQIPPPFESVAERRWVEENKATPYTQAERLPVRLSLAPGTTGE